MLLQIHFIPDQDIPGFAALAGSYDTGGFQLIHQPAGPAGTNGPPGRPLGVERGYGGSRDVGPGFSFPQTAAQHAAGTIQTGRPGPCSA